MSAGGLGEAQTAELEFTAGTVRLHARLEMTTGGLLAVGALVGAILLASSVIVWTSTSPVRRHPLATRLGSP
jgi:hypothetical protein